MMLEQVTFIKQRITTEIYNDAWNIDQNDPRRSRGGIYFSELKDIAGKKILM